MATNMPAQPAGAAQGGNQQPGGTGQPSGQPAAQGGNQQPATSTGQPAGAAQARTYTRQEILRESLWITISWTWFTTLVVRGAVPVLVATMAYDGYRQFPGAPPPPAQLTLTLFIIQFVTLDLGGLALEKRAKAAGFALRSFPRVIALSLIGITLVTMISTGIEELWPTMPDVVTKGLAAALLIGRMVLTVFYCKAVDGLDEVPDGQPDPGQVQTAIEAVVQPVQAALAQAVQTVQRLEAQVQRLEGNIAHAGAHAQPVQAIEGQPVQAGAAHHLLPVQAVEPIAPQPKEVQVVQSTQVQGAFELNAPKNGQTTESTEVQTVAPAEVQGTDREDPMQEAGSEAVHHDTEPLHLPVQVEVQGATPPGFREQIFAYVQTYVQREGKAPLVREVQEAIGCGERTAKTYRKEALEVQR